MPETRPTSAAPSPAPVDPPMVPFAAGGMVVWALAGLVLLLAGAPTQWLWICLAGFLLGLPGLAVMVVHDRNRRRRRQQQQQQLTTEPAPGHDPDSAAPQR